MATSKQERAIQLYKENYGSGMSYYEIMRKAGYSHSSAKNPKVLTESLDWQQAMDQFIPDDKLLAKHVSLLDAKKIERAEFPLWIGQDKIREILSDAGCFARNFEVNPMTGIIHVWYWAPDTRAQAAALDLAYKVKGKMTTKVEHSGEVPVALVEFLGDEPTTSGQDSVSS